jgi:putative chitinase
VSTEGKVIGWLNFAIDLENGSSTTGRNNYAWASRMLGVNLIDRPFEAASPELSAKIAGLYWQSRNLNYWADMNSLLGFKEITRRINGGLNGWKDRLNHWERIKQIIC